MNGILEDMLDLSALDMRRVKLILQPIKLGNTINLVVKQADRALQERGHTLVITGLDELPVIEGDEVRLFQIFRQLFSNAIKFTPDGGYITISGQADSKAGKVRILFSDTARGHCP